MEEKKARLKKRMEEFWALREQGKLEETWGYFDPAYRASFPNKYYWLARQSPMSFSDFSMPEEPTFTGVIAKVPYKISATMPQQVLGEAVSEVPPPKEVEANMRWGWFYDNWYFIPDTIMKKHLDY